MSKAAPCLKLIQILSCRGLVSTAELAELLETNPRNIREYIKEIEMLGYTVTSITGKYGGYRLDKRDIFPSLRLTDDEKTSLLDGTEFLQRSPDFLNNANYQNAMGKIMSSFESNKELTPITMIDRFPLAMDKNLLQQRYMLLSDAIEGQIKCEMTYLPASNIAKVHTIHPYKLFVYNGAWFVLAWSERINDFGYYKLNRIEKIEKTRSYFTKLKTYDESNYLDSFGMTQNGDYYHIKLELKDLKTVIQERIYGKNQKVEEIDSHYIHLSCDMQNKNMILSFVLSFGSKCKVLEPEWLRDMVNDELNKILDLYKN